MISCAPWVHCQSLAPLHAMPKRKAARRAVADDAFDEGEIAIAIDDDQDDWHPTPTKKRTSSKARKAGAGKALEARDKTPRKKEKKEAKEKRLRP